MARGAPKAVDPMLFDERRWVVEATALASSVAVTKEQTMEVEAWRKRLAPVQTPEARPVAELLEQRHDAKTIAVLP